MTRLILTSFNRYRFGRICSQTGYKFGCPLPCFFGNASHYFWPGIGQLAIGTKLMGTCKYCRAWVGAEGGRTPDLRIAN